MKKLLFGFSIVAALGGSLLTQSFKGAPAKPTDILYKPGTCETRNCQSTTEVFSCEDLTVTCNGSQYSGNLTRSIY